jgi:hypothetical protein
MTAVATAKRPYASTPSSEMTNGVSRNQVTRVAKYPV